MYNKIKDGGGILEIISKRLKQLREDAGLSQSKIGQLVGVPQSSIYRYEQGQCIYRHPRAICTAKQSQRAAQIEPPLRTPEPLPRTGAPQHRNPAGSFPPP